MTKEFYVPYQFVPATGFVNGKPTEKTPFDAIRAGTAGPVRHDLWIPDSWSGRILCRLRLATPTFVGAVQVPGDQKKHLPAQAEPYERDGRRAIPGNSLRGMVASVAEAISQSALRVLEDRHYSVRKPMRQAISAVGCIVESAEGLAVEPLTLPALRASKDHTVHVPGHWQRAFGKSSLGECLAAYIEGYEEQDNGPKPSTIRYIEDSFLEREPRDSSLAGQDEPWYVKLAEQLHQPLDQSLLVPTNESEEETSPLRFNRLPPEKKNSGPRRGKKPMRMLLGQKIAPDCEPRREERDGDTPGWLRVLGIEGREGEVPARNKKHELFIPRPRTPREPIPIPEPVLQRLERLVLERAADTHKKLNHYPFFPAGYDREPFKPTRAQIDGERDAPPWRPKPGMLVFFDIRGDANGKPEVSELAFSSIWRCEVPVSGEQPDRTYAFFRDIGGQGQGIDLLPWGSEDRTALTPAESVFGVVEQKKQDKQGRNLAGRVRFHDALPLLAPDQSGIDLAAEVTLRTLGSPKPPSPAMYFHPEGARSKHISKDELNAAAHRPNGRKVYLHHPDDQIGAECWRTRDDAQDKRHLRIQCTPMAAEQQFLFHVDFENLSLEELTLLRTALEPDRRFCHRLGLGKPLGLGSVEVRIEAVLRIDRRARYGPDACSQSVRFQQVYLGADARPNDWPEQRYAAERISCVDAGGTHRLSDMPACARLIDTATLADLLAAGDPTRLKDGVHVFYPLTSQQLPSTLDDEGLRGTETDGFKWFVLNEDGKHPAQALPPLPETAEEPLRTLRTHDEPPCQTRDQNRPGSRANRGGSRRPGPRSGR